MKTHLDLPDIINHTNASLTELIKALILLNDRNVLFNLQKLTGSLKSDFVTGWLCILREIHMIDFPVLPLSEKAADVIIEELIAA